jgi:hypothetical protein
MASWNEVAAAAGGLADDVRARFEATGLGLLATLRKDGSPRISGIEPSFAVGEVWLGMMDGSLKALDLRRDPRLAVHSATVDKEVKDGDARIAGRAEELFDGDPRRDGFVEHLRANSEFDPDAGSPFHVFRVDVSEVMFLRPEGDHLDIRTWREGGDVRRIERR